jgi:lipoyl(octanoyl) transferase
MFDPEIRPLGLTEYLPVWREMQQYTDARDSQSSDQLWITQHYPVYTQGLNGRAQHLLQTGDIPVIQVDRGGQVTYHGPGQLVIYCLLDLQRLGKGVRRLVTDIEQSVIALLADFDIPAKARRDAPGVYIGQAKIAALGLRIRKGCCYHGLSLNLDMDLAPFAGINPCGYEGLEVTQLADHVRGFDRQEIEHRLCNELIQHIGTNNQNDHHESEKQSTARG